MAGELKQADRPADDASCRARPPRSAHEATIRVPSEPVWFDATPRGGGGSQARSTRFAAPFFGAALVVIAAVRSVVLRVLLPLALALAAVALLMRGRARSPGGPAPRARRRGLALHGDRLDFDDGKAQTLLFTDAPFGVTLVSTPRREALVAVLSSSAGTFSIRAELPASDRPGSRARLDSGRARAGASIERGALASGEAADTIAEIAALLASASTTPDGRSLEAIGPDGAPLVLGCEAFVALVKELASRNPTCLSRFVLSDARGAAVTLDPGVLAAGERVVDLSTPLEWRALLFEEAFGQAAAYYQGTWVRQGTTEFVVVSLASNDADGRDPARDGSVDAAHDLDGLDRGALRDVRLMQAVFEPAPPTEQRVAIERIFMMPLRAALDEAPRAARAHPRAQA